MKVTYTFTPKEQKIRKLWLTAFLIYSVPALVFYLFCTVVVIVAHFKSVETKNFFPLYLIAGAAVLFALLYMYVPYRCVYKSAGSKLLTFFLVVVLLLYPGVLYTMFQKSWDLKSFCSNLIFHALFLSWCFLCFKVRQINKKARAQQKILAKS